MVSWLGRPFEYSWDLNYVTCLPTASKLLEAIVCWIFCLVFRSWLEKLTSKSMLIKWFPYLSRIWITSVPDISDHKRDIFCPVFTTAFEYQTYPVIKWLLYSNGYSINEIIIFEFQEVVTVQHKRVLSMMKKTRSQFASTQKMVNSIKGVRGRSLITSHKDSYFMTPPLSRN